MTCMMKIQSKLLIVIFFSLFCNLVFSQSGYFISNHVVTENENGAYDTNYIETVIIVTSSQVCIGSKVYTLCDNYTSKTQEEINNKTVIKLSSAYRNWEWTIQDGNTVEFLVQIKGVEDVLRYYKVEDYENID